MRYHYIRTAKIKNKKKTIPPQVGEDTKKGSVIHRWQKGKMVAATLENIWQFLTKLNTYLPYNQQ